MAVMKLRSLDDKNRILNSKNDYSQIFGYDITIRETTASEYFKYAQNLSGKTKYIRLKVKNEQKIKAYTQGPVKGAKLCLNPYFFGWLEK